jgi:hypothetical protein
VRWRKRSGEKSDPVLQPGPKVTTPEALAALENEAVGMDSGHGARRSMGAGALHTKYRGLVSRRDLDAKLAEARRHANAEYRRGLNRLEWRGSHIVWAMDDTEYGTGKSKRFVHNVRDLGAQYVMEPVLGQGPLPGAMVAKNLEKLFRHHGAPLFLKRDNATAFCCGEVNVVLAEWGVIPLTSPPYCPTYNGAIEWSQAQLKEEINCIFMDQSCASDATQLHVRLASHSINHRNSRTLHGQCPCHTFATSQQTFTLNERKLILSWIMEERNRILESEGSKVDQRAASRKAATRWLINHGLLIIRKAD